jgi:16S rRNA (guanine966-N2)-methyltransferase
MLTSRLGSFEGRSVLDVFAGTGALGLEALSRGAARATFVESDRGALEALRANVARLGAEANVLPQRAEALGRAAAAHHLAFLDPPYEAGLAAPTLERLAAQGWLAPLAWVSVETARDMSIEIDGFAVDAVRDHGKARLHVLRYEGG